MKRKIFSAIFVLTILLCVPLAANAASVDDLTFDPTTGTITGCKEEATGELVIPEEIGGVKVTNIGDSAFSFCVGLTSVNIPNSVISIGIGAFQRCDNMISVNIPNSVTSIGNYAFGHCNSLKSIDISDSVINIDYGTFRGCENLNINVNPNNQNYCDIDGVLFTKDKKTIMAYTKAQIQPEYVIPDSVTCIGGSVFYNTCIQSVTIPDSVTSIGDSAFFACYNLKSVVIPDSVTSIDINAFNTCGSLNINVNPNNQNYRRCFVY